MITTYLISGLGNQMFQYAVGRALSLRLNTELFLDLNWFSEEPRKRKFELDKYNINVSKTPVDSVGYLVKEIEDRVFYPKVLSLPDNTFLMGYWQSGRYFEDYADVIRSELTLKIPLSEKSRDWARKIQNDPVPVSIHVRRGDYVNDSFCVKFFYQLSIEYYDRAVRILHENFPEMSLYIFSNDLDWCRRIFNYDVPMNFVDGNDEDHGYEDLELMKLCRHHIIANSTFSWWGAWLDGRQGSLVFAPDRHYVYENSVHELGRYPDHWIILKA